MVNTSDYVYSCSNRTGETSPEWNGMLTAKMILPFVDMTTKGWVWYQVRDACRSAVVLAPAPFARQCPSACALRTLPCATARFFRRQHRLVATGREQHGRNQGQQRCQCGLQLRAAQLGRGLAQGLVRGARDHRSHGPVWHCHPGLQRKRGRAGHGGHALGADGVLRHPAQPRHAQHLPGAGACPVCRPISHRRPAALRLSFAALPHSKGRPEAPPCGILRGGLQPSGCCYHFAALPPLPSCVPLSRLHWPRHLRSVG